MKNKIYEYKGIFYQHAGRGKWVITSIDYLNLQTYSCEQDLKNYIDTKIFKIDLINRG